MTKKQLALATRLQKVLVKCHDAGLAGGVYEGSFYVWPQECTNVICNAQTGFFKLADLYGARIYSNMRLDGGSGS